MSGYGMFYSLREKIMTAQVTDTLTIDGEHHELYAQPDPVDRRDGPRRDVEFVNRSTCCYRGYVAHWTIDGGWLCLSDFSGNVRDDGSFGPPPEAEEPAELPGWVRTAHLYSATHFGPGEGLPVRTVDLAALHGSPGPILATWVNDVLYIPSGDIIGEWPIAAYPIRPSHFRRFAVEGGRVRSVRRIANRSRFPGPPQSARRRG